MDRTLRDVALSPFGRQRFVGLVVTQRAGDLDRLTGLIEAGSVVPSVDRTDRLARVPEAMRYLAAGKVRGKVAIGV